MDLVAHTHIMGENLSAFPDNDALSQLVLRTAKFPKPRFQANK
jgi:hypothetical protein